MGRRIETGSRTPTLGVNQRPEDFLGRLVKYIPAEIVGLYLAATAPVPKSYEGRQSVLWSIFGICAVLTPIYLWFTTRDKRQNKGPLVLQIVLATIAFPIWVFALGEPFSFLSWYEGWMASVVLIFVTFVFALVKPPLGS